MAAAAGRARPSSRSSAGALPEHPSNGLALPRVRKENESATEGRGTDGDRPRAVARCSPFTQQFRPNPPLRGNRYE